MCQNNTNNHNTNNKLRFLALCLLLVAEQQITVAATTTATTDNHQIIIVNRDNLLKSLNQTAQQQQQHHHHHNHHHYQYYNSHNASAPNKIQLLVQLHFGAKVALTILLATILLVASATLVDLNSSASTTHTGTGTNSECGAQLCCDSHYATSGQQTGASSPLHHHHHQSQRNQRSPSLSSSTSSSLFCSSANSVASASAPILGHSHHRQRATSNNPGDSRCFTTASGKHRHQQLSQAQASTMGRDVWQKLLCCNNHYVLNLQMYANQQQPAPVDGQAASDHCSGGDHHHQATDHQVVTAKGEDKLLEAVYRTDRWRRQPAVAAGVLQSTPAAEHHTMEEAQQQQFGHSSKFTSKFACHLLQQLFLSFSLRHSASIIFQSAGKNNNNRRVNTSAATSRLAATTTAKANSCVGHRSRVSSLSSINESGTDQTQATLEQLDEKSNSSDFEDSSLNNYTHHHHLNNHQHHYHTKRSLSLNQQQQQQGNTQSEQQSGSIDSLHGLRFLSMIWIIVIHSYTFALRWLYFTNTSTLDDIYKTAASQLLANGSFACDSFFFAGGFLLPYLAFPAFNPSSSEYTPNHQHPTSSSPATAASSTTSLASRSPSMMPKSSSAAAATTTTTNPGKLVVVLPTLLLAKESAGKCSKQDISSPPRSTYSSPNQALTTAQQQQQQEIGEDSLSSSSSCDSRQSSAANTCLTSLVGSRVASPMSSVPQVINNHNQNHHWHQFQHESHYHSHNLNNSQQQPKLQPPIMHTNEFTFTKVLGNILHRYIRMMPLMMAIIGLSATLLRYLGEGPAWDDSTMMFDKWCRKNWWINALFLHNFLDRENMCLSHSWYSAVDIQLFLIGQLIMFVLFRSKKLGLIMCCTFLFGAQLITATLTLIHHLPAVPLIASFSEQSMNLYYGQIYIKPYCRASPYLIGILLAYLMRTTSLGQVRLKKWQVATGWTASIGTFLAILMAMQPAMNGQPPSELQSALYSAFSRPLWACATGWMIFACITKHGGIFESILSARCFVPLSRLTYPAFLIHPIVMAVFYGSRQTSFHFSHYLMLYLILGNIVITYASAFILSALFELPLLSAERAIKRAWCQQSRQNQSRFSTGTSTCTGADGRNH